MSESLHFKRHRRLRSSQAMRDLVRENNITTDDLIYPLFVVEGEQVKKEVPSMPGVFQISLDYLNEEIDELQSLGIKAVILFGVPSEKDEEGTGAFVDHGIVQKATRLVKAEAPEMLVIADTCLCEFTSHGHCGVIHGEEVANDESLPVLAKTAVSQAKAGADIIAPSNMMDGFVVAIRSALDEAGFVNVPIMSYAVKYASAFYGPFRDAADSSPQFGDRKTYQMDPANGREALREAEADVDEGADFLIVKPTMSYLDVVRDVKDRCNVPIVGYNVSGEYAMVKAAAQNGWVNEQELVMEILTSMKRAGAELIITYFSKDVAKWISE